MNGQHPSSEQLQRGHDGEHGERGERGERGELASAEAAALRSHLAGCAQCQSDLASLTRMGELVRATVSADAALPSDAEFARLFENVERAIRVDRVAPVTAPAKPVSKKVRYLQRAAPALGAVALAAAAMLMVYRQETQPPSSDGDDGYEAATSNGDSPGRSEVVDVDFGPNAGTVFDISLADGSSIPVVWINDDDGNDQE
jgi:hypothetical protein